MRGRIAVAFFAGMLFCVLTLGAGVGAFYALSDDAQAQSEGTWQLADVSIVDNAGEFRKWVVTVSDNCSVQTLTLNETFTVYYRCPSD